MLAQAAPAEALTLLRGILQWTDEDLKAIRSERTGLARALAIIAVWQPQFKGAAKILARLCFAESSNYSNNCRGTLKELFIPFNAPTQMPFGDRVPLALSMLVEQADFNRELGLDLCAAAFKVRSGGRVIDVEFQGTRPEIMFWHPQLWTELTAPWSSLVNGLLGARNSQEDSWKAKVDLVLIEGVGGLITTNVLHDLCLQTLTDLSKERRNFDEIYQLLTRIIRYSSERLEPEVIDNLAKLRLSMDGSDFHSRLLRNVLSAVWDDEVDEVSMGESGRKTEIIRSLAKEAVSDLNLLREALPDLFSSGVIRFPSQFGEFLAIEFGDARFDQELLDYISKREEKSYHPFLCGYLTGVFKLSPSRWEPIASVLLSSPEHWIVLAVVDSGTSLAVFDRLLQIFRESTGNTHWVRSLVRSHLAPLLSRDQIHQAIKAVLEKDAEGYDAAIEMADWALCKTDDKLDIPVAMKVLVAGAGCDSSSMADYHWGALAMRLFERAPQCKIELFKLMIDGTVSYGGITSGGKMSNIMYQICKEEPSLTWPIVADALLLDRAHLYRMWLGEPSISGEHTPPAITAFSPVDIFAWVDVDRLARAPKLIDVVPKTLDPAQGGDLTTDFLARYLDIEGIGDALRFFFEGGGYSGPRSLHLAERRTNAQRWMSEINSPLVTDWLEDYVQKLSEEIDEEKINEERRMW